MHWGARPGVARYRLQLASDSAFADILFDRVVAGNDYQIKDLSPGRYFWRVAPLTDRLGDFSSAAVIAVRTTALQASPTPLQSIPTRSGSSNTEVGTATAIVARGGWRAAVGDIAHPVLAHLRSPATFDLVGINSDGVIYALDANSGFALWSTGRRLANSTRATAGLSAVLLLPSRTGLDNVLILSGVTVFALEGPSGRELWRTTLPTAAASGTVIRDNRSAEILVIDNSLQRLFALDAGNGNLRTQTRLPHRVVGALVAFGLGTGLVMLAYDTGQIEVRDGAGVVARSGNAGSPATTPPLFVAGKVDFVLVGTRNGLTALTADDLIPIGMVAIKEDSLRGILAAQDLDGDRSPEIIMSTNRGRVIAVTAADGKILWETNVGIDGQPAAFADVNGDGVLDVVLFGGQSASLALSGRDGSVVWKDNEPSALIANHATALAPRSIVAMPFGSGVLLISSDPSHTGLRALEFSKGSGPRQR